MGSEDELGARIDVCDEIVAAEGDLSDPAARLKVAAALVDKGEALRDLGRHEEAAECFGLVEDRFGADALLGEPVAHALRQRSRELLVLGRADDAAIAADALLERFGVASDPAVRRWVAGGAMTKAIALTRLKRPGDAEATADWVIEHFADDPLQGPERADVVALSLWLKIAALRSQRRSTEVLPLIDELIGRVDDVPEERWRVIIAKALSLKAKLLVELDPAEEAAPIWRELIDRFADEPAAGFAEPVVDAMWRTSLSLDEGGDRRAAVRMLSDLIDRFGSRTEPGVLRTIARALHNRGVILWNLGQGDEAILALEELHERFSASPPSGEPFIIVQGDVARARYLIEKKRLKEAVAVSDQLLERLASDTSVEGLLWYSRAAERKCEALAALEQIEPLIAALDDLLARIAGCEDPQLRLPIARASGSKLWALTRLGRIEPAGAISDALLTLFTAETNPEAVAELGRQVLRGVQTLMHTPKSPSRRQVATRRLASTILGTLNRPNSGASTDQQAEADDQRVTSPPRSRGRFWRTVEREQWRSEQALKLAVALLRRFERTPDERLFSLAVQGQAYRFVALKRLGRWRDLRDAFVEGAPAGHNNFITANGDGADDERQQKRAAGVLMARAMRIEREANPVRTAQAYGTFAQQFQQAKSLPVQSLVKLARKAQQKAQAG